MDRAPDRFLRQAPAADGLSHPLSIVTVMNRTASEQGKSHPAGGAWEPNGRDTGRGTLSHPLRSVVSMTGAEIHEPTGEPAMAAGSAGERHAAPGAPDRHSAAGGVLGSSDVPLAALAVLGSDPTDLGDDGLGDFLGAVRVVRAWVDAREAAALTVAAHRDVAGEAGAVDVAAWLTGTHGRRSTGGSRPHPHRGWAGRVASG